METIKGIRKTARQRTISVIVAKQLTDVWRMLWEGKMEDNRWAIFNRRKSQALEFYCKNLSLLPPRILTSVNGNWKKKDGGALKGVYLEIPEWKSLQLERNQRLELRKINDDYFSSVFKDKRNSCQQELLNGTFFVAIVRRNGADRLGRH